MKKKIGVVHIFAECHDCGKMFENYKNGQAMAAKHAKNNKHKITGDIGLFFEYNGREEKK